MAAASRTGGVLSSRPMKKYSFKDSTSALKQVVNKATHSTRLLDQSVQAMKKHLNLHVLYGLKKTTYQLKWYTRMTNSWLLWKAILLPYFAKSRIIQNLNHPMPNRDSLLTFYSLTSGFSDLSEFDLIPLLDYDFWLSFDLKQPLIDALCNMITMPQQSLIR